MLGKDNFPELLHSVRRRPRRTAHGRTARPSGGPPPSPTGLRI
jgi:hypothetical protein